MGSFVLQVAFAFSIKNQKGSYQMPSIHLPYVNIALNAFALVVTLIIFVACINEYSNRKIGSKHFLFLQSAVVIALISDMVGWLGDIISVLQKKQKARKNKS